MSRIPAKSRGAIPKTARTSTASKTSLPDKKKKPEKKKQAEDAAEKAEALCKLPAFSIALKAPKVVAKDKAKHLRRNKPPGEEIKKLKEIMLSVRGTTITVQEFIGLVSPSTGDNGECLRLTLAEELNIFRNTARKIYETMTQDVSEVLTNEHIMLTESCQEKYQLYTDKMVRTMNQIYQFVPDFDFEKYYMEEGYMDRKFERAKVMDEGDEGYQNMMRQEAYHRYQWLKSEGERLKAENTRLQKRMNQLKKQQRDALKAAAERERIAEEQRATLEETQVDLQEQLEELNTSVEKVLVESEKETLEKIKVVRKSRPPKLTPAPARKPSTKPKWAAEAAAKIETEISAVSVRTESSKVSVKASSAAASRTKLAAKKKKLKQREPFSTSPLKSPPRDDQEQFSELQSFGQPRRAKEKRKSPEAFHYSPPKTPPGGWPREEEDEAPPPPARRIVESSQTVIEQAESRYARARAPRDTWGGFG